MRSLAIFSLAHCIVLRCIKRAPSRFMPEASPSERRHALYMLADVASFARGRRSFEAATAVLVQAVRALAITSSTDFILRSFKPTHHHREAVLVAPRGGPGWTQSTLYMVVYLSLIHI